MNVKIVYHSDSGNTKKLALAISEATGVPAEEITGHPDIRDVDLLFVGGSVRAFSLEKNCKDLKSKLVSPKPLANLLFTSLTVDSGLTVL